MIGWGSPLTKSWIHPYVAQIKSADMRFMRRVLAIDVPLCGMCVGSKQREWAFLINFAFWRMFASFGRF